MSDWEVARTVPVRFSEDQWLSIARELGPNLGTAREELEQWAAELVWIRKQRRIWNKFPSLEQTNRFETMTDLAKALLSEIKRSELHGVDFASTVVGGWTSIENDLEESEVDMDIQIAEFDCKWGAFIDTLKALDQYCAKQVAERREWPRSPANVDLDRNMVWAHVSEIYLKLTGDEPSAYVGAPGSKNEGIAAGRFVRFMQAWMSAVPGQDKPKPEEIRWFVRRRLPELRWW